MTDRFDRTIDRVEAREERRKALAELVADGQAMGDYDTPAKVQGWIPICQFDRRMFSIMTNGTPDTTEVVKYKGEIPGWAKYWKPLDDMPPPGLKCRGCEECGYDKFL